MNKGEVYIIKLVVNIVEVSQLVISYLKLLRAYICSPYAR